MKISFYETADGKSPAKEFISAQNTKMRVSIYRKIDLLREFGTDLRMPHSEYLGDGIFQLRAQSEGNAARVIYFFMVGEEAILTNGFMKKTPKTPANEIDLAKQYRADFLKRQEESK